MHRPDQPEDAPAADDRESVSNKGDVDAGPPARTADEQGDRDDVVDDASKVAGRMQDRIVMDADGLPKALRWRPHLSWKAMVAGAIADLAIELILQQAGLLILDARDLVEGIIQGSILGALAPMIGTACGVLWVNTRIARMRTEAAA